MIISYIPGRFVRDLLVGSAEGFTEGTELDGDDVG